jgi:hypothetical protein
VLYLLDANVLISAHELHYPIDRIPQFWTWLLALGESGRVKMPYEIHKEIADSTGGDLKDWVTTAEAIKKIRLDARINQANLRKVITEGYAPDLNDSELEEIGQDPFLVGYALPYGSAVTVVTREVSKPSKKRKKIGKFLTCASSSESVASVIFRCIAS